MDDREIYKKALDKWGEGKQTIKVIEEMSELTKELCKSLVGGSDRKAIVEEVADVKIMIEQLEMFLEIKEEVGVYRQIKIDRLEKRLSNG